jgi:hypothetical protein
MDTDNSNIANRYLDSKRCAAISCSSGAVEPCDPRVGNMGTNSAYPNGWESVNGRYNY